MPQGGYPIPPAELVVGPFGGELLKDGKIDPVVGDVLDIVETALAYRKSLKDAEKQKRRDKRKIKQFDRQ